jgi:hypothetical protein
MAAKRGHEKAKQLLESEKKNLSKEMLTKLGIE